MSTKPHEAPAVGNNQTATSNAEATSAALPEFGNFATLRALFNLPRSSAYELEAAGEIQFSRLRKRGNVRGRVLVNLDSVRAYLMRCTTGAK